ncbi:hypothetical protein ASZ90_015549 [hydrocarbon metagenome]|uniref:Uncharacterized protein n=1 Tax=hydrocarbon metagenome TaxID=938273 RepID=A0A0W8F2I4_9ZZZZ
MRLPDDRVISIAHIITGYRETQVQNDEKPKGNWCVPWMI